jgi:hypothetical protein
VLVLPTRYKLDFSFDPNEVIALDERATVYPVLRASDEWGQLEANGAMMVREGGQVRRIVVPVTKQAAGTKLSGDDWTLELARGFRRAEGGRRGDEIVRKD